jgi:hypothetical protein
MNQIKLRCIYCDALCWDQHLLDKHIEDKHPEMLECEHRPLDQYNEWCVTHNQVAHLCHNLPNSGIVRNGSMTIYKETK